MKNSRYMLPKVQMSILTYGRFVLLVLSILGFLATFGYSQTTGTGGSAAGSGAANIICQIFNTVRNLIFLLGITLVILGAAVYAAANIMPSQSKGGFQGYGMGMIIGGIVGVVI